MTFQGVSLTIREGSHVCETENEEPSSMLSFEISELSSTTPVNKVICRDLSVETSIFRTPGLFIKRTFEVKLYRIAAE